MKKYITENTIMELLHTRVTHRPAVILEGYHKLPAKEQQQINESYNAMYDLLMDQVIAEFSLGGAKAKIKGAVAGAKAGFQGDQNAGNVGKSTEIQSLFDDVKRNIGTIVAQHKNDLAKMGMTEQDPAMQKLASMEQAISAGGSGIEVKDNSAMAKVKQFGAEKVMPLVSKAISPVVKQVEKLYNNSGPIKDFDTKYQQLITQISEKNPQLSQAIGKFSEVAKQHKGKATFIIGALTAILTATGALAAGGTAAFVVGVGLRGVYGMLSGEPPAKAFGKAAITAAIGKLVGGVAKDLFGDVDMSGADETMTKAGVGSAMNGGEVADAAAGASGAKWDALSLLKSKYPEATSFSELRSMDPEGTRELLKQWAGNPGSEKSLDMAARKLDSAFNRVGGEVADAAGGDTPLYKQHWDSPGLDAGERWAIRFAADHPGGISPDYIHDVITDKDLQQYFMDGNTINTNKLNGVLDVLSDYKGETGGFGASLPGKDHFNAVLQHHLNGGTPEDYTPMASSDGTGGGVADVVTGEPSEFAKSIELETFELGYNAHILQQMIDNPEIKPLLFGPGDELTYNLNTHRKLATIMKLVHADPSLDFNKNFDDIAAMIQDKDYIKANIAYADQLNGAYQDALSSGSDRSGEFYKNAMAKYQELQDQGPPRTFGG